MFLIAHRGNINGPSSDENLPDLINHVLSLGYHAEIDVWYINGEILLGHDAPVYAVPHEFIQREHLWCHAKNIQALEAMMTTIPVQHCFWHQTDNFTLTRSGYIWTYPGQSLTSRSIAVMPETVMNDILKLPQNIAGICSDHVSVFK